MEVLNGLLYINEVDVFDEYSAFLTEDAAGKHDNYSELLAPPKTKPYIAVDFREDDGEKLPDVLPSPAFQARDVVLYFAILADISDVFFEKYYAFIEFLKSGWLEFNVIELKKTYKMYYLECSKYDQLTEFVDDRQQAARFSVKFREPIPDFNSI